MPNKKKLNLESAEAQMQVADGATSHSSFCLANAATARRFNQFLEFIRKAAKSRLRIMHSISSFMVQIALLFKGGVHLLRDYSLCL